MIEVVVQPERRAWSFVRQSEFVTLARRAFRSVTNAPLRGRIGLLLVGDRTMKTLQRTYRQRTTTTDVLSFPYTRTRALLGGEIAISVPQARRQARRIGQSVGDEIRFLFVHGVLHLLGLDHERSAEEERVMFALQDLILKRKKDTRALPSPPRKRGFSAR